MVRGGHNHDNQTGDSASTRSANRAGRARRRRTIRQGNSRSVQSTDAVDDQALRVEEGLATFDEACVSSRSSSQAS
jgi:hypothetical protein